MNKRLLLILLCLLISAGVFSQRNQQKKLTIKQFQQNPAGFKVQKAIEPPDGPPIGNGLQRINF